MEMSRNGHYLIHRHAVQCDRGIIDRSELDPHTFDCSGKVTGGEIRFCPFAYQLFLHDVIAVVL